MSFQYENNDDDDDDGLYIALGTGIGFVVSFIGTLVVIKFADVFCSTEVSEEALARMIARLEQRDEGLLNKSKTIFANMSEDERRNVLEKVLLRKPYTNDVINEIKSERAASIAEEGHARVSLSVPLLGLPESIPVPSIPSSSSNQTEDHDTNLNQHTNNTNSKNSTMWPLGITRIFTNKEEDNNDNNNNNNNNKEGENENDIQNEKDERTKIIDHEDDYIGDNQCAICMESYEVGTDVTIGKCCLHMFHTRCILKWMCAQHDFCPFCRKYLFDVGEFKDMVESELGAERFGELVQSDAPDLVEMYMNINTNTDALITNGTENENEIENNNESDNESENGRNNNSHDGTENMDTEENNDNSSNDSGENINNSTETNTGVTDNTQ